MGKKMGFTEKRVGHMTLRKFSLLYQAYKNDFDLEMAMTNKGIRYIDMETEATLDDVIPF